MHVLFVALQILLVSNFVSTGILITKAAEVPPPTSSEQPPSTQSSPTSATPSPSGPPSATPSSATPSSSGPPSSTPSPTTLTSSGPPSSTPSPSSPPSKTPSPSGPPSTTPSGTTTPTTSSTASTTTTPCTTTGRFPIADPNCQKYYYCYVDGTNVVMYNLQCPNSLLFNPKLQKCVLPASYTCTAT